MSDWQEHQKRHAALCARWGKPQPLDTAEVLGALGADAEEGDVFAFRYESVEAAEAFAASNLEHNGYRSLGPAVTPDWVIGAVVIVLDAKPPASHAGA